MANPKESKNARNARIRKKYETQQKKRQIERLGYEPPKKPKHDATRVGKKKKKSKGQK